VTDYADWRGGGPNCAALLARAGRPALGDA